MPAFKKLMDHFDPEDDEYLMTLHMCLCLFETSERLAIQLDVSPKRVLDFEVIFQMAK